MSVMAAIKPRLEPASSAQNQARDLVEQAEAAFEAGDYRLARALFGDAARLAPGAEVGQQALHRRRRFRVDPVALYSGAFGALLYLLGWLFSI